MESKRKIEIEDTLVACMLKMPFSKITVSKLCRQSAVSRRVFYYHYENMDACLNSLILRTLSEGSVFISVHTAESMSKEQEYYIFLEYWQGKADFLKGLSRSGCFVLFRDTVIDYILAENSQIAAFFHQQGIGNVQDILKFYLGGICDLLMRWAQADFSEPMEEMVAVLMQLMHQSF